jgi:hypothetical protein
MLTWLLRLRRVVPSGTFRAAQLTPDLTLDRVQAAWDDIRRIETPVPARLAEAIRGEARRRHVSPRSLAFQAIESFLAESAAARREGLTPITWGPDEVQGH